MCLGMRYRYHVLAVAFDVICFDILARALIEEIFEVQVLVCDGTGLCPYSIP